MVTQLKNLAKKSRTLVIANNIYDNWRSGRRFEKGQIESDYGSTHSNLHFSLSESLAYIERTYNDYLHYAGVAADYFRGKRILELGVGDNYGVALKFIAAGAAELVCLDKFYSERNPEQEREIYVALREHLDGDALRWFDEAIDLENGIEINPAKLKAIYGTGAEQADKLPGIGAVDEIISRGVLQSVHETDAAFVAMDNLLAPGGLMIHKMDLRDLGMFIIYGMHPLTHLTVPASVYKLMVANTGKSNRKLIGYYRDKMKELGYEAKIFTTILVGQKEEMVPHKEKIERGVDYDESTLALIEAIRPKLAVEFRDLPDEELMISGIFLVARKPAG